MKRTVLCGALGGVALCFPLSFVSFLPYLSIENMETMLGALIGFGGIAVAAVLLYKNRSFKHAVLRTVIMFACCIIVFRLFAITGMIQTISNILRTQENAANDRVAGLGMVFFLIPLFYESVIISGILLIRTWIKRRNSSAT